MRRDREIIRRVMVIVIMYCRVCQDGVEGNILKTLKYEDDNNNEEIPVDENTTEKILEDDKSTDDTENGDQDIDSDETNTLYKRVQEIPLKLGLQLLTAKYRINESLDKAREGSGHIYEGVKVALKTMADFVGDGIGNARFLLFGSK